MGMRLTYQTGIATFIQFIVFSFLTFASQVGSVVTTCHKDGSNCVSNLITSVILYILVAIVFCIIWIIGYGAQERRSKRLAQLLICIEAFVALDICSWASRLLRRSLGAVTNYPNDTEDDGD